MEQQADMDDSTGGTAGLELVAKLNSHDNAEHPVPVVADSALHSLENPDEQEDAIQKAAAHVCSVLHEDDSATSDLCSDSEENWDGDDVGVTSQKMAPVFPVLNKDDSAAPDLKLNSEENWDKDVQTAASVCSEMHKTSAPLSDFVANLKGYREDFQPLDSVATFSSEDPTPAGDVSSSSFASGDRDSFVIGKYQQRKSRYYTFVCDNKKIFVKNVGFKTSLKVLWDFCSRFGRVKHCQILLDRNGRSSGRATVTFYDESSTKAALEAKPEDLVLHGRTLFLSVYRKKVFPSDNSGALQAEEEKDEGSSVDWPEASRKPASDSSQDSDVSDTPINKLSDEMIACIFKFLSLKERLRIESVCKRWRSVSLSHWSNIRQLKIETSVYGCARLFMDRDLKNLLKRGTSSLVLLDLSMALSATLTDHSLNAIAQNCIRLKVLNISGMNISNNGLRTLSSGCQQLESITIHDRNYRIGEKGLWWIFHKFKKLRHIDIKGNKMLKGQCLHVLGPDVTHLNLGYCDKVLDLGIQKVQLRCPLLQNLSVANCFQLTDVALQAIGQCSALVSLDVSCNNVSATGLKELCRLKNLESLTAVDCVALNDEVLVAISQACRKIRTLNIRAGWLSEGHVTDIGIESVATHCQLLSSLNIGLHSMITDSSLGLLSCLETLTELILENSYRITDEGIMTILMHSPSIETLDIRKCPYVGDATIDAAIARVESDTSKNLFLNLLGTSADPSKISKHLPGLRISCVSELEDDDLNDYEVDENEDDELCYNFSLASAELDDFDGFLDTDDPLEMERWEMS